MFQSLFHNARAVVKGIRHGTLVAMLRRYFRFWRADRAVTSRYGLTILEGAFAGMKYILFPPAHHVAAKVLGTYERELNGFWQAIMRHSYDVIVNIGSAEGYYAVGLARHFQDAHVFAFDIQPREQRFCVQLAALNGVVDRVEARGLCDVATLQAILSERSLIVIDCEGCEYDLLDPTAVSKLFTTDIVVEIHDFGGSTRIADAVQLRFAATHDVQIVVSEPRDPQQIPKLGVIRSETLRRAAVLEREDIQRWFFLRAKMRI